MGTPFLSQNRPESVKRIYRALKRDHPEMPAEMKARIAARQGKPGKQHQGPPYKGPLTSSAGQEKVAKVLTAKGREQIAEENFALPGRRYPIHDASHARNALARVAQHGTPAEQAVVRRAVRAKYPNIDVEKTAMFKNARAASWAKGLGLFGAGGTAGYVAGHRTGVSRDMETPYSQQHMRMAYQAGQTDVVQALRRRAAQLRGGIPVKEKGQPKVNAPAKAAPSGKAKTASCVESRTGVQEPKFIWVGSHSDTSGAVDDLVRQVRGRSKAAVQKEKNAFANVRTPLHIAGMR